MFPGIKFTEEELLARIDSTTELQVHDALDSGKCSFDQFLSLLSPMAAEHLDLLRVRAQEIRRMHFGRVVRLYAPIYFSNYCINRCVYCGFRCTNSEEKRRRLTVEETIEEGRILRSRGIDSVLLIAGEDPKTVGVDYVCNLIREMRKMFHYVSLELQQQEEPAYRKLFEAGAHGLTLYQETYDAKLYPSLHPAGPKSNYFQRTQAPLAAARAGFYNVGIGALFGLYNWRSEAVSMAAQALAIRRENWQARNQFSFPRITPMAGGFHVPHPVNDKELEQMILAFRIYFPEADIFLSTREHHEFRMRMAQLAVSHISAGSQVSPGGYAESLKHTHNDLGQFTVNDDHSVKNVIAGLKAAGLEPVFKDWDTAFGGRL